MIVNINNLSPTAWGNIEKALRGPKRDLYGIPDEYLIRFQQVLTPGHSLQIHITPNTGEVSEYRKVSNEYCWEIIVSNDSRYGRYCTVCSFFKEPAKKVFMDKLGWSPATREKYVKSLRPEKFRLLEQWFAHAVLKEIFENIKFI